MTDCFFASALLLGDSSSESDPVKSMKLGAAGTAFILEVGGILPCSASNRACLIDLVFRQETWKVGNWVVVWKIGKSESEQRSE